MVQKFCFQILISFEYIVDNRYLLDSINNIDLTNYGQMLIYGLNKGVGRSQARYWWISAGRRLCKNRIFFHFLYKNIKTLKSKNRLYFGGLPRPSIYFWTLFCPKPVKLQFNSLFYYLLFFANASFTLVLIFLLMEINELKNKVWIFYMLH